MRLTRVAMVAGIVVLGLLCWLAAIGVTAVTEALVTVFALVVLVGGGNWLSGRSGTRTAGAPRPSSVPADPVGTAPGPGTAPAPDPAGGPPEPVGEGRGGTEVAGP